MPRSVKYRYIQADIRQLVHRIDHLTHILQMLVAHGHTDKDILLDLNQCKAELLITKQLLQTQA